MNKTALINEITAHDIALGSLCIEAEYSYKAGHYMAALACIFVLLEGALKYGVSEADNLGFKKVIDKALKEGVIDKNEHSTLHKVREIRNAFFHDNHYEQILATGDLLHPLYEEETKKLVYETYSGLVFKVVERIINKR